MSVRAKRELRSAPVELPETVVEVTRYVSDDSTAHHAPRYVKVTNFGCFVLVAGVDETGKKS